MRRLLIILMLAAPGAGAMSLETLACGATICLAGDGGSGCDPYLKKYYSIDGPTSAITKRLRKAFLALCKDTPPPDPAPIIAEAEREMKEALNQEEENDE